MIELKQNIEEILLSELQAITCKLHKIPSKKEVIKYTCFSFYLYKKTYC